MDQFTQRILENAQSRSKKLGISNMSKVPLTESNVKATPSRTHSTKSKTASPKRRPSTDLKQSTTSPSVKNRGLAVRTVNNTVSDAINALNIDAKENVDLALEINITTGPNVQVQVEVEEQELDSNGKVLNTTQKQRKQIKMSEEQQIEGNDSAPSSCIRASSRNQLHRLGALYSNPQDLSSPVHRTETAFSIEEDDTDNAENRSANKLRKLKRLAELTNSINKWEDESTSKYRTNKNDNEASTSNSYETAVSGKSSDAKGVSGIKPISKSPGKLTKSPSKYSKSPGKTGSILSRIESIEKKETDDNKNSSNKQLKWDKSIMDSLESQGFKRRDTTNKRLEYNFSDQTDLKESNIKVSNVTKPPTGAVCKGAIPKSNAKPEPSVTKKTEVSKGLVFGRAAIFETSAPRNATTASSSSAAAALSSRNQKDPAEMSLRERMALFEKNKGTALIPKAALGMAPSAKQIMADKKPSENVKQVITTPQQPMISSHANTSVAPLASKINNFNKASKAETCAAGSGIRQTVAALLSAPATIAESRIANDIRKIRQQEMNVVLNRFNQQSEEPAPPPPAPPMPENLFKTNSGGRKRLSDEKMGVSPEVRKSLENIKRVKVNPPKNGHSLYPTLSDIESSGADRGTPETYSPEPPYTDDDNEQHVMNRYMYNSKQNDDEDSYMDSEDDTSNLSGRHDSSGRHVHYFDSTLTSTNSESSEMDKYLDEAIENEEDDVNADCQSKTKLQKGTVSSTSFSYERKPLNRQEDTIYEDEASNYKPSKFQSPIKSRLTVNPSEDNNSVTLTHTVSFYRRQQNLNSPSVQKIVHSKPIYEHPTTDDNTDFDDDDEKAAKNYKNGKKIDPLQQKINELKSNMLIQSHQIAQASNALNTCASTFEFSGSSESVVAEWKLLVATHSRKAAQEELQRLEVERCLRPADAPKECGRLTIKDIVLPLREDYVKNVSDEKHPHTGHHLVCLLKYNENVLATRTIPTLPGLVSVRFPGELHLDNVYADFKITLEIYGMVAQRESLPHDIKYHIRREKKGVIKTPKGKKAGSTLIMPPTQSPAGPNAVRTPAFVCYGFVIFSLREVQRNTWTLNSAPNITPLVGTVHMKINCELSVNIDHKSFLTMFEDVSGFGAWHRRWCRLHGSILSYWKYPDDERTKPPIGSLDLSACEQHKITTAPRDMCARLNTLMIELKRPSRNEDEDSMFMHTQGPYTYVRHLLSADTKQERDEWCAYFNKTLALMRAWGNSGRQSIHKH